MFNHEKLKVYQHALTFNVKVNNNIVNWDNRHAVADQLNRAAGSILENIAMASAAYTVMKVRCLDYAIGSTFECAACLDLAGIRRLIEDECILIDKQYLLQILRMLIGLRRSWSSSLMIKEDAEEYASKSISEKTGKFCGKDFPNKPEEQFFSIMRNLMSIV